ICTGDTAYFPISKYEDDAPGTIYFAKVSDGRDVINFDPKINDIIPIVFDRSSCGQSKNRWEVEFFVQNACNISSVIGTVAVSDKAKATMTVSPSATICLSTTLTVKNSSDYGNIISGNVASGYVCSGPANPLQAWNITPPLGYTITGDKGVFNGTTITTNGSPQLSIQFTKPGTYIITEYVSNTKCSTDSIQRTICVRNNPTAAFNIADLISCNQDTVKFLNTSVGENECSGNSYKWNFTLRNGQADCNNGLPPLYINSKDTSKSPEVWFRGPGIYDVNLTTTALNTGLPTCAATNDTTVTIKAPPKVTINNIPSICSGSSISPTANVTDCYSGSKLSFNWTFPNGSIPSSPDSIPGAIIYNASGTQTVKLSVENSCGITEAVKTFDITTKPTAEAGNAKSICSGVPEKIGTNTGNYTYQWSPSTGLNNPNIAEPTVTLINNSIDPIKVKYYVTVSAGVNCTAIDSVEIEVKQSPAVTASPLSAIVCKTDAIVLSASGATTYTWSPATYLNALTGNTVTSTPLTSITYTVTGALANGCADAKTINLTVGEKPIADAGPSVSLCSGKSVVIGLNTGNNNYQWSPSTGLNNANIAQPTVALTNTGNNSYIQKYYLTVSTALNCTALDSVEVEVKPSPTVTANPITDIVCTGDSRTLTASGATSYTWSPNTYLNIAIGNSVVSTPANSIIYTVTGSLSNGCADAKTINISVVEKPVADAGPLKEICSGSTTAIGTDQGAYSYQWYPTTGLNSPIIAQPNVTLTTNNSGNDTAIYYVTVSAGAACSVKDSVQVVVKPAPLITVPANPQVCAGDSIALSVTGATNYTWFPADFLNTATGSSVIAKPSVSTTYTVTGSFANGCTDEGGFTLIVNPVAVADFTSDLYEDCAPYNLNSIIHVTSFSNENKEYTWILKDKDGETKQTYNTATSPDYPLKNAGDSVSVYLVAVSRYGCKNDTTQTFVFKAGQNIKASFTPDKNNVCEPATITFNNVSSILNNSVNYSWNFGNGNTGSQIQPPPQEYSSLGNYTDTFYIVSLTAANKCSIDSLKDTIYLKAKPLARFNVDSTFGCSPVKLKFTNTSLGSPFNYYWNINKDSVFNTSSAAPFYYTFYSDILDTFNIHLAATNACGSDTLPLDIVVAPNTIVPKINTFGSDLFGCAPHTVIFNNSTSGAFIADWSFDDGSGITLPGNQVVVSHTFQQPGNYNIRVNFNNGCSKASDSEQVVVYQKPDAAFSVFPVPNNVTCFGDSVRLNITSQNGDFNKLFWGDEGALFYTTAITSHKYKKSDSYTITLVSERTNNDLETVCTDSAIQVVKIGDKPFVTKPTTDSAITCFNPGARLNVSGGASYIWQPDLFLSPNNRVRNPVASPKESTVYTVDVYGASGCVVKDSVKVIVDYSQSSNAVKLPNAFTPNGDGRNDCFGLAGRGMIEQDGSFDFAVYDRWGVQLFHTKNPSDCWDGTYHGAPQASGTYVYVITYKSDCLGNKNIQMDKSTVILIR
ncbi:MAG: PKD domain-containing protein, partial [Panacibacter sp.]